MIRRVITTIEFGDEQAFLRFANAIIKGGQGGVTEGDGHEVSR